MPCAQQMGNVPSTWQMCLAHGEAAMRLGHYQCTQGMVLPSLSCAWHTNNVPRAPENSGHICIFLFIFWVNHALFAQTQVETLTINISLPHSEFLVQNWSSSRGRRLWSLRSVSIFSLIFQGMFLSLVICYQLPYVTKSFQVSVLR